MSKNAVGTLLIYWINLSALQSANYQGSFRFLLLLCVLILKRYRKWERLCDLMGRCEVTFARA